MSLSFYHTNFNKPTADQTKYYQLIYTIPDK
jgi:hypothetical protein